jgi:hypothetical protein
MYLIIYLTTVTFSFLEIFSNKINKRRKIVFFIAVILAIIGGMRYGVGTDYFTYYDMFKNVDSFSEYQHFEIGFRGLVIILKQIGFSPISFFTIFSFMSLIPLSLGIIKSSYYPLFSIFIYFNVFYPNYSFNAVGQAIPMGIFILLLDDIAERNLRKVIVWSIIASLFHYSGILILVAYFLSKIKLNYLFYLFFTFVSVIFIKFNDLYYSIFIRFLPELIVTKINFYSKVFNNEVNMINLMQRILILLPFLIFYKILINTKKEKIIFRIYFIGFIFYVLFSFQGMFATRVNMFFRILEIILFPIIIKKSRNKFTKIIFISVIMVWATLLLISVLLKPAYFPYKTWL